MLAQYIVGDREFSQREFLAADVNCDGKVDALDVVLLHKYILGVIDKF